MPLSRPRRSEFGKPAALRTQSSWLPPPLHHGARPSLSQRNGQRNSPHQPSHARWLRHHHRCPGSHRQCRRPGQPPSPSRGCAAGARSGEGLEAGCGAPPALHPSQLCSPSVHARAARCPQAIAAVVKHSPAQAEQGHLPSRHRGVSALHGELQLDDRPHPEVFCSPRLSSRAQPCQQCAPARRSSRPAAPGSDPHLHRRAASTMRAAPPEAARPLTLAPPAAQPHPLRNLPRTHGVPPSPTRVDANPRSVVGDGGMHPSRPPSTDPAFSAASSADSCEWPATRLAPEPPRLAPAASPSTPATGWPALRAWAPGSPPG
mmetsp:Transcript_8193/g.17904  ORF Transcript_8193/g.17904 Transcript_8193/m.17904 type:complete len:318 (-) Transcript_8193:1434-2387(-)